MFGEVYKIDEQAIPGLVKKARKKLMVRYILMVLIIVPILIFSSSPYYSNGGPTFWIPIIIPLMLWCVIILIVRKKKPKVEDQLRAYELTISEGSMHCQYNYANQTNHVSIAFNEVTKISYYLRESILIVGKDLSHSFSIPKSIEKREEIIRQLSAIKPITDAKKEIRIYYLQRINSIVLAISILLMIPDIKTLYLVSSIAALYAISLPVYFFFTTRNMTHSIKRVNGIYVVAGLVVCILGIVKFMGS